MRARAREPVGVIANVLAEKENMTRVTVKDGRFDDHPREHKKRRVTQNYFLEENKNKSIFYLTNRLNGCILRVNEKNKGEKNEKNTKGKLLGIGSILYGLPFGTMVKRL